MTEIIESPERHDGPRGLWRRSARPRAAVLVGGLTVVLLVAIGVVITQSELSPPDPDQWLYTRTLTEVIDDLEEGEEITTWENESWIRADFQETAGRKDDGELTVATGSAALETYFAVGQELYEFYQSVLDDPASITDAIDKQFDQVADYTKERGWSESDLRDQITFELIHVTLGNGAPPSEVQEALYQAFLRHPSTSEDGIVPDATGRDSVAISMPVFSHLAGTASEEGSQQLLFDPEDHIYHGWRWPNPARMSSTAVLATGIVDEPGQVP